MLGCSFVCWCLDRDLCLSYANLLLKCQWRVVAEYAIVMSIVCVMGPHLMSVGLVFCMIWVAVCELFS